MAGTAFVMVGFGAAVLSRLDPVLPPGSLTVVEDPHIVKVRKVRDRLAGFACVAELIESPVQDEDTVPEQVTGWTLPAAVAAVLPGLEYGVVGAAALAERLGLPGAGLSAARLLRDKVELRTAADRAGLAQPRWRQVRGPADVRAFGHPAYVLKPANRQASIGVQLLDDGDDLEAAWERTVAADEPLMRAPGAPAPRYLVEARLHGPEISVECLVHAGEIVFENVTAKTVRPGRHPVELGHSLPEPLTPAIADAMRTLVAAIGFQHGTLHAEWILVDGRPHLVECAGRLPGDEIVPLIDLAYGGNLAADLVTVLTGTRPAQSREAIGAAAIRFLTTEPGLVTEVRGVEPARAVDGVIDLSVSAAPGDRIGTLESSWDRVGRVIAIGPTADAARQVAAEAARSVRVVTRDVTTRTVTGPADAATWWPPRPADPRDSLGWAAGVLDPVRFLGLTGGPALWLREHHTGRMEPIDVLGGPVAGLSTDPASLRAAREAWPRFVVSAATGYGSPMVRAGAVPDEQVRALVAALISHAREQDAVPAVLHCPAGDPLLRALAQQGFAVGLTDLYPTLELPGEDLSDYLAALPKNQRTNVRREIRDRAAGTAEVYVGEQARPHLAAAARLNASAYRQRGEPGDDQRSIPIYSRLLDTCGDDFVLTMVADADGPVASAVLIAGDTDLLLYSAGLELPRSRAVAGYFNAAYYLPVEFGYRRSLKRIRLGPTGWHTKRLRGAHFDPLCSAVPSQATELVALLAATDARLRPVLERFGDR